MNNYYEFFEKMKVAGKLAASTLGEVTSFVKPGISTSYLDKICYEFIKDSGGKKFDKIYIKFHPKKKELIKIYNNKNRFKFINDIKNIKFKRDLFITKLIFKVCV